MVGGSPPHTRGILGFSAGPTCGRRLTPAYAGNINVLSARPSASGAHPRLRGEYPAIMSGIKVWKGSPPYTRGISAHGRKEYPSRGLTPAYAGNIRSHTTNSQAFQAHPRIRGEYPAANRIDKSTRGSPPLTRGISGCTRCGLAYMGLTPAYAGNIESLCCDERADWAHPRIRGEHGSADILQHYWRGSPPLTRGILRNGRASRWCNRLTPAYAGNQREALPALMTVSSPHPYVFFPPIPVSIAFFTSSESLTSMVPSYVTVKIGILRSSL